MRMRIDCEMILAKHSRNSPKMDVPGRLILQWLSENGNVCDGTCSHSFSSISLELSQSGQYVIVLRLNLDCQGRGLFCFSRLSVFSCHFTFKVEITSVRLDQQILLLNQLFSVDQQIFMYRE